MALTEHERRRIDRTLVEFCERHNRPELKDQLSLEYEVEGHNVTLFERRPRWDGAPGHTDHPVAKFKFVRTAAEWRLFWQRADLKWHAYTPRPSSRDLSDLVDEVDQDPHACFFG